jgi:hypothetical protein
MEPDDHRLPRRVRVSIPLNCEPERVVQGLERGELLTVSLLWSRVATASNLADGDPAGSVRGECRFVSTAGGDLRSPGRAIDGVSGTLDAASNDERDV